MRSEDNGVTASPAKCNGGNMDPLQDKHAAQRKSSKKPAVGGDQDGESLLAESRRTEGLARPVFQPGVKKD